MDESYYIKEVANAACVNSFLTSPAEGNLSEDLPDLIRTQEEPFSGPSVYGQYKVMGVGNIKTDESPLDGQGGDEVLGGYSYYFGYYFFELFKRLNWFQLSKEVINYFRFFQDTMAIQMFGFLLLPRWLKTRLWRKRVDWVNPEQYKKYFADGILDPRWAGKSLSDGQNNNDILFVRSSPLNMGRQERNEVEYRSQDTLPGLSFCRNGSELSFFR